MYRFEWPNPKDYEPICSDWTTPEQLPDRMVGLNNVARMVVSEEIDLQTASDMIRGFTADMKEHEILESQLDLQVTRAVMNVAHDIFVAERLRRLQTPLCRSWDVV